MFLGPRAELLVELLSLAQLSFSVSGSPAHPHPCKSTQVLPRVHTYTLAYTDTAHMFMSMSCTGICACALLLCLVPRTIPLSAQPCLSFPGHSSSRPGPTALAGGFKDKSTVQTTPALCLRCTENPLLAADEVSSLPKQGLRVFWPKLTRTGMMAQHLTCTWYFTLSPPSYVV